MNAPGRLAERAGREPKGVALRAKHLGLYRERTWAEYCDLVARGALGLEGLGVTRGAFVALFGDVSEEALVCELGAQALGAVTCGLEPTLSDEELVRRLQDSGAVVVVAGDPECEERILSLAEGLSHLKSVVVLDPATASGVRCVSYEQVLGQGAQRLSSLGKSGLQALVRLSSGLTPESPAFLSYAKGTRGEAVSHGRQLDAAADLVRSYPALERLGHRTVAYLPLANSQGRTAAVTLPLLSGVVPHFGENPEDVLHTLFEVAPTVWLTVPGHLGRLASQVLEAVGSTSPVKARAYAWAVAAARKNLSPGDSGSLPRGGLYRALRWLVLRPVLNELGFDQLELVVTGGEPLAPEAKALWQIYGLPVVES